MRIRRGFQGAFLGLGAPMGWLAWRAVAHGVDPFVELAEHHELYIYMTVGTVLAFALFALRVSESEKVLRSVNEDLSDLAVTDALTGLRNARFFHARLDEAVAESERSGRPLSLVMLDLDHFKAVNDTYGHAAGDEVLAEVAARLHDGVRAADTAARIGGEEFALLLVDTPFEAATATAERLRKTIESHPIETQAGPLAVTISGGVASNRGGPRERLFSRADAALYEAKAAGRNCVVSSGTEEVSVDRAVG